MPDLKQTFILRALADYNQLAIDTMRPTMRKLKVEDTGEGAASLAFEVFQSGKGAYSNLSFREYLRMVDMGAGRGHPLGGLKATQLALQSRNQKGLALVKDRVRKPKKIYAKVVYGKLNHLIGKLLFGYTEETINMLKAELENKTIQNP